MSSSVALRKILSTDDVISPDINEISPFKYSLGTIWFNIIDIYFLWYFSSAFWDEELVIKSNLEVPRYYFYNCLNRQLCAHTKDFSTEMSWLYSFLYKIYNNIQLCQIFACKFDYYQILNIENLEKKDYDLGIAIWDH